MTPRSAESVRVDVVKVAGFVRITAQMAEDIRRMKEAMSHPVSQEEYEAWLAEPDDEGWYCTDECDHEASVYQCEQSDGSEGADG